MSVLIKGMKMPTGCCQCPLFKSNNSGQMFCRGKRTAFGKEDAEWLPKTTPNWCPLVLVPDHGRLIDADAAITDIRGEILEHQMNGMKGTPFYIEDLRTMWQRLEDEEMCPTIIPADPAKEGE